MDFLNSVSTTLPIRSKISSVWVEVMLSVRGSFRKPPLGSSQVTFALAEHAISALVREAPSSGLV